MSQIWGRNLQLGVLSEPEARKKRSRAVNRPGLDFGTLSRVNLQNKSGTRGWKIRETSPIFLP